MSRQRTYAWISLLLMLVASLLFPVIVWAIDTADSSVYRFVPGFHKETKGKVIGGEGGELSLVTLSYEDIYALEEMQKLAPVLQAKIFDLSACKTNPYAIYSNAGSWYDEKSGEIYAIDVRLSITDYVYQKESSPEGKKEERFHRPYAAFSGDRIGVLVMGSDCVRTRMEFYYHNSTKPVQGLQGKLMLHNLDAWQNVILLVEDQQHIWVRDGQNATANFSGSRLDCIWTLQKYANQGYEAIKADFAGINTNTAMITMPADSIKVVDKNIESGDSLSGATFQLQEWSEKRQKYICLMNLQEREIEGEVYYSNEKPFTNTMDNCGSYQVVESEAPKGYSMTKEAWQFTADEICLRGKESVLYRSTRAEKEQKGVLIYKSLLEKKEKRHMEAHEKVRNAEVGNIEKTQNANAKGIIKSKKMDSQFDIDSLLYTLLCVAGIIEATDIYHKKKP